MVLDAEYSLYKRLGSRLAIWSCRALEFLVWNRTLLFVRNQIHRKGISRGTFNTSTAFPGGRRQAKGSEVTDTWGTNDVSTLCKEGPKREMPKRDVVSWTAMIAGYAQQGKGEEAFECFRQMQREGVKPNKVTFGSILKACASPAALERGRGVHAGIIKAGLDSDIRVANALVSMYCKCGSVVDAHKVFGKMGERDVVSWTAMIAGWAEHGHGKEAFDIFWQMQKAGVQPNKITFMSILTACAGPAALTQGKQVHAHIIKAGFESDVRVGNALVSMYAKCGSIVDARQVFDTMPERNVVSWTALVNMYCKCGNVLHARQLFNNMPNRNVVSWNVMIAGMVQHGDGEEAFELFRQMQQEGVKPDKVTFMSILSKCANLAAFEEGKRVHTQIHNAGLSSDVSVGNALVDMYAKCGSVVDARQVFNKILNRDVISWTAMIIGYAQHGLGEEALRLFEQMQHEGVKPDKVTFVGVLSACSHVGLVHEGRRYFNSMNRDYGITPTAEHYGCMVDLFGRSGCLIEAENFIRQLPVGPGPSVWGALLGACRIHGNVGLAERAAECALKLEPHNAAVYVLLSNIYAAAGRWEKVAKVRKMMEDRGVKKEPGYSWIEVKNKIHKFVAEDRSHPQTEEIYDELERLTKKMKEAGFMPDTRFVLHDLEEHLKEQHLCHHSEKLAIAFGLITTPPGSSIYVTKNLRVCGDCHTATKFISKLFNRDIVARDTSRFHHFNNGVCSCGDRW